MLAYIVRRVLSFVPLLFLLTAVTYTLAYYGPGDPIREIMGQNPANEEVYQSLRRQYGLDRPIIVQIVDYLWGALRGDFGRSFIMRVSVSELMWKAWFITAQLAVVSIVLTAVLGIGLGVVAALRPQGFWDAAILFFGTVAYSVPSYVLAPLLLILLVLKLRVMDTPAGWQGFFSAQTLLAGLVLSLPSVLIVIRQTRNSVLETLSQDYVRTARAKGLPERAVLSRHILRNALTPTLTSLGLTFGFLLGGSIFVETAFAIPGFGQLYFTALRNTDYPLLLGTTVISAFWVMVANLIVDIAYGWLDPRVRLSR